MSTGAAENWPGRALGLPETGRRSVARLGRRAAALAIDWALATLLSLAFFSPDDWQTDPFATLGIFAVLQVVFQIFFGGGLGHLMLGMRVVPITGGPLGVWRPLVRTLLLCLAIPALIWDKNQRGMHDVAAGTVLVRV